MKRILVRLGVLILTLLLCFTVSGCGPRPKDSRKVASVGDITFTYDEFRYFFMNCKTTLDGGDDSIWEGNEELKEQLNKDVLYCLRRFAAVYRLAEQYGIELTKDDEVIIKEYYESIKSAYGSDKEFKEAMDAQYFSEYSLMSVLRYQYLYESVWAYVIDESHFLIRADDEALYEELETNFWRGAQILIRNDQGDDPEANRRLAEEALAKLEAGANFFQLISEYGEDPYLRSNLDGYYFTTGRLLPYFEEGVRALDVGEHSQVVECVYGYAIIMRLEMEDAYVKKNLEELRDALKDRLFMELLEETLDGVEIETTPLFYQLTVENME